MINDDILSILKEKTLKNWKLKEENFLDKQYYIRLDNSSDRHIAALLGYDVRTFTSGSTYLRFNSEEAMEAAVEELEANGIEDFSAGETTRGEFIKYYANSLKEAKNKSISVDFEIHINDNGRVKITDVKKLLRFLDKNQLLKAGEHYLVKDAADNITLWKYMKSMDPHFDYELSYEYSEEGHHFYNCLYIPKKAGMIDYSNIEWEASKIVEHQEKLQEKKVFGEVTLVNIEYLSDEVEVVEDDVAYGSVNVEVTLRYRDELIIEVWTAEGCSGNVINPFYDPGIDYDSNMEGRPESYTYDDIEWYSCKEAEYVKTLSNTSEDYDKYYDEHSDELYNMISDAIVNYIEQNLTLKESSNNFLDENVEVLSIKVRDVKKVTSFEDSVFGTGVAIICYYYTPSAFTWCEEAHIELEGLEKDGEVNWTEVIDSSNTEVLSDISLPENVATYMDDHMDIFEPKLNSLILKEIKHPTLRETTVFEKSLEPLFYIVKYRDKYLGEDENDPLEEDIEAAKVFETFNEAREALEDFVDVLDIKQELEPKELEILIEIEKRDYSEEYDAQPKLPSGLIDEYDARHSLLDRGEVKGIYADKFEESVQNRFLEAYTQEEWNIKNSPLYKQIKTFLDGRYKASQGRMDRIALAAAKKALASNYNKNEKGEELPVEESTKNALNIADTYVQQLIAKRTARAQKEEPAQESEDQADRESTDTAENQYRDYIDDIADEVILQMRKL